MAKNFLVEFSVNIPYPKKYTYRTEANNYGTAINRAYSELRKEKYIKGKRLKEIRVWSRLI